MYLDPQSLAPSSSPATPAPRPLRVGMIGIGTVGAGTFRVLARNQAEIAARAGRGIEVVVVCARNLARAVDVVGTGVALTNDPLLVATHPDVDVVVEVAGGSGPARDWVLAALRAGRHVVTANKALLAEHGTEIFAAARQHGVVVAYEAAVAGSIPIIKALREGLTANRIEWLAGIINGTTNFILSRMADAGLGFAEALAQAQALGYAEADPTFDIEGIDAAHKLTLLAALAHGVPLQLHKVHVEGITQLQAIDMVCAERLGYRIKLLGVARRRDDALAQGLELRVHPALLPATHLMAQVNGSMNAVMVQGDAAGSTLYCGAGAGSEQTASAVIADLVDVARLAGGAPTQHGVHAQPIAAAPAPAVLPMAATRTRYYLRVPVADAAQGCAQVTQALADCGVPLQTLLQHHEGPGGVGDLRAGQRHVVVLTQVALEADVDRALARVAGAAGVHGAAVRLRVELLA
ncbi:homoserine dehydrogenase [Acidovorax soli]|uniref:Homoserine dehydrogenase n=2 Tax=Acidovorax TaxID=12916 RepID=A0A1H3XL95_9BURK|nr:homoserine dehydrogenase [Acidovorax soli]SDZ99711.1 homoserine dehydrogenase [Acidovorax soli]